MRALWHPDLRSMAVALIVFFQGPLNPTGALCQESRTFGIQAGRTRSELLWDGPDGTGMASGVTVGMALQVQTPLSYFSVRPELAYVQRGTVVREAVEDPAGRPQVRARSHYLSLSILGRLAARFWKTSFYVLAGPTVDHLLETECSADLCQLFLDERPSVLAVTVGMGGALAVGDGVEGDLEIRLSEGLTEAYRMTRFGARYRSIELILRTRFPF